MNLENNIYKKPTAKVTGMSSRQQVLFLLQKTQKEADWDMENDSDFLDGTLPCQSLTDQSHEEDPTYQQLQHQQNAMDSNSMRLMGDTYAMSYNEEFERRREKMVRQNGIKLRQRQQEFKVHPERLRLLAYSLTLFTPIKKNKYLERKKHVLLEKEANQQVCNCQKATAKKNEKTNPVQSFNCGERCINRCVSTECFAGTCPSGMFCKNRHFQLHQNAWVFPAKTEKKGWGLFAGEFISKGTFVMQYVGEIFSVDSDLGEERVKKYKNSTCTYLMRTNNNEVIDPTNVGNIARFINHSCDPNCQTRKWNVLGEVCVGIFAIKDIKENEELSFDYQFDFFKTPFTKCYCGTAKCKGYLGVLSAQNAGKDGDCPECSYCSKEINDMDEIVVCNGYCCETFHAQCIIKKESKNKSQAQNFLTHERKNYICKDCIQKLKAKGKRGKRTQLELDMMMKQSEIFGGAILSENPQEDKDITMGPLEIPPWESKDPAVKYFYEDNEDNRNLDLIIAREIESVETMMQEIEALALSNLKFKRIRKKNIQFSYHYNFMSELQKRLKMRVKQNKKNFKFRMHRDDIRAKKQKKLELIENKRKQRQSSASGRRGKPKKMNSAQLLPKNSQLKLQPSQSANLLEDARQLELSDNDEESKKELNAHSQDDPYESDDSSSMSSLDENEEMAEANEEDEVSDMEEEEDDDEDYDEEDEEDEDLGRDEDQNELNLEKLQDQLEEQEETKHQRQKEEVKSSSNQMSSSLNQFLESQRAQSDSLLKKRLRMQSIDQEETKYDPRKSSFRTHFISPRKNSILNQSSKLDTQAKDKAFIEKHIQSKIDSFFKDQQLASAFLNPSDLIVRESKFNVFEIVFNLVVPDNIDKLQSLPPANFQIFWEQAWGGMVTAKISSTYKQYQFITNLMQETTDLLFKNGLLTGVVNSRAADMLNSKEMKNSFPFDIVMIKVPKNFIRKIIGYQEKNLTTYRKAYTVDFYFDKELLVDDVFQMNETAQIRIFGRNCDVLAVNELIQKDLATIKMKTVLLQMNDCKILMDSVKEVKVLVDPCELRIKKMTREWKDLRHPFYYIPNYFREMALIGTEKEIQYAESQIEEYLQARRDPSNKNVQQISYLLPFYLKNVTQEFKNAILSKAPNLQLFFYEPTFPRKHLTVLLIGPWSQLIVAKKILEDQANSHLIRSSQTFENFQQYTYHQQIRFSFKSLKRFVLEQDIKYLNHWDVCSIFLEDAGKPKALQVEWHKILNSDSLLDVLDASHSLQLPQQPLNDLSLQRYASQQTFGSNPLPQQQIRPSHQLARTDSTIGDHDRDYMALIDFLKTQDVESCINSLFVLVDSKKAEESLKSLMTRLHVGKSEIISYMLSVLSKNIEDYEESHRYFIRSYEPIKVIEHEIEGQERLVIQQIKDVTTKRPQNYYQNLSPARSRSSSREMLSLNNRNRSPDRKKRSSSSQSNRKRSSSSEFSRGHSRKYSHDKRHHAKSSRRDSHEKRYSKYSGSYQYASRKSVSRSPTSQSYRNFSSSGLIYKSFKQSNYYQHKDVRDKSSSRHIYKKHYYKNSDSSDSDDKHRPSYRHSSRYKDSHYKLDRRHHHQSRSRHGPRSSSESSISPRDRYKSSRIRSSSKSLSQERDTRMKEHPYFKKRVSKFDVPPPGLIKVQEQQITENQQTSEQRDISTKQELSQMGE